MSDLALAAIALLTFLGGGFVGFCIGRDFGAKEVLRIQEQARREGDTPD